MRTLLCAKVARVAVVALACVLTSCSGGGGDSTPHSNPESGVFAGVVVDADGFPVAGARVSVDGVEANAVTSVEGRYVVSDPGLVTTTQGAGLAGTSEAVLAEVEISVLADGFTPYIDRVSVSRGAIVNTRLIASELEPDLELVAPSSDGLLLVPEGCDAPVVRVEGYARLGFAESLRLDVVIALDRSGSASRDAFDVDGDGSVDSVLDAEIAAARCLLESLDWSISRVALIAFSDSSVLLSQFTDDFDTLDASLDLIGEPLGGTNYEAAFSAAGDVFESLTALDALLPLPEADLLELPVPRRAFVLLSDGIVTSHGVPRDTSDSNLAQSRHDRDAAIAAAAVFGARTGAELHGISIIPANDTNRKRTTLPHCVSMCGGGSYENVTDPSMLQDALCGKPLGSIVEVEIHNETAGDALVKGRLFPDGFFSEDVPVHTDLSGIAGEPDEYGVVTNELLVVVRAFSGEHEKTTSQRVRVRVLREEDRRGLDPTAALLAQASSRTVTELDGLQTPTGGPTGDNVLHELLVSEFEDARVVPKVETLAPADGGGIPDKLTVTVHVLFTDACYQSDFGYIVVDPEDLPSSHVQALGGIPLSQSLFNTGALPGAVCEARRFEPDEATYEFTIDEGDVIAFFLLPDQTLEDFQENRSGLKPLFSIDRLNPGKEDQVLTFLSLDGRTEPGASTTLTAPGPFVVFGFEDLEIARRRADQDFTDLVVAVRVEDPAPMTETDCEE